VQHSRAWKPYHELHKKQQIFVLSPIKILLFQTTTLQLPLGTGLITQTQSQTQKLQDRNHIMKKKKKKMMMPKKSLELALKGFKVLVVACFRNPGIQELGF